MRVWFNLGVGVDLAMSDKHLVHIVQIRAYQCYYCLNYALKMDECRCRFKTQEIPIFF
jgi:hypothetical protein